MKISSILLMAGSSVRFGEENKLVYNILNRYIFTYSADVLSNHPSIGKIIFVVSPELDYLKDYIIANYSHIEIEFVYGGSNRAQSVRNALSLVNEDFVLIHDAARPLITKEDVDNLIEKMSTYKCGTLYHDCIDTIKDTSNGVTTLNRKELKAVSTPQFFHKSLFEVILNPKKTDEFITDEISLVENNNEVCFIKESSNNLKITTKNDIDYMRYLLDNKESYLIGHSFDFHPFIKDKDLILGGVKIPFEFGLDGHSNADVVYHVVSESIIGALGLGDLGTLFPDNDDRYLNIDSSYFVEEVVQKSKEKGYLIENIDLIIYLEKPNLKNFKVEMMKNIKKLTNSHVNVKATTLEKKGVIGNGEGIACEGVVLLKKA